MRESTRIETIMQENRRRVNRVSSTTKLRLADGTVRTSIAAVVADELGIRDFLEASGDDDDLRVIQETDPENPRRITLELVDEL